MPLRYLTECEFLNSMSLRVWTPRTPFNVSAMITWWTWSKRYYPRSPRMWWTTSNSTPGKSSRRSSGRTLIYSMTYTCLLHNWPPWGGWMKCSGYETMHNVAYIVILNLSLSSSSGKVRKSGQLVLPRDIVIPIQLLGCESQSLSL